MGLQFNKRVLRRGSEKRVSIRCLELPLGEYERLGVCPKFAQGKTKGQQLKGKIVS